MLVRTLAAAALVATCVCCAITAHAEPLSEAEEPTDNPEYDRLLKDALSEFQLGNWTEARSLFERAHEIKPSARTLRAIGLASFEAKSYADAVAYLTAALADPRRPLNDEQRTEAQYAIQRSLSYIAQYELELSPASAQVRVDSREPIMLDGKLLLDPGKYQLEVTADGYQLTRESITARPRENLKLRIELSPKQLDRGAPHAQDSDHGGGLSTQQWIGIAVGSAGVVGLGVGAYFGLTALSKADEAGCSGSDCPDARSASLNDEAYDMGNLATITLIAGAALTTAGVVLIIVPFGSEAEPTETALHIQPVVAARLAGVNVAGAF